MPFGKPWNCSRSALLVLVIILSSSDFGILFVLSRPQDSQPEPAAASDSEVKSADPKDDTESNKIDPSSDSAAINKNESSNDGNKTVPAPKASGLYESVTLDDLEYDCDESAQCAKRASDFVWYVCGSNGKTYKNLGILLCSQLCNKDLKLVGFRYCEGAIPIPLSTEASKISIVTTTTESVLKSNITELMNQTKGESEKNSSSNEVDPKITDHIKRRMLARESKNPLPSEDKDWCRANPKDCYVGFDPAFNPINYLVHTNSNDETKRVKYEGLKRAQLVVRSITKESYVITTKRPKRNRPLL